MLHLEKHKISYFKHFKRSICFSIKAMTASIIFVIHAFVPDVFTETGSDMIKSLVKEFDEI